MRDDWFHLKNGFLIVNSMHVCNLSINGYQSCVYPFTVINCAMINGLECTFLLLVHPY